MSDEPKAPRDAAAAPSAAAPASPVNSAEAKMRAALADEGLQEALRELDAAMAEPDPGAPDPVVVLPGKGGEVRVADTAAAAAYVQPTVRPAGRVPQDTLTRVRVDSRVDPRRQPTERKLRSDVLLHVPAAAGAAPSAGTKEGTAAAADAAALPSSRAPSVVTESQAAPSPGARRTSSSVPPPSYARPASAKSVRSQAGAPRRGVLWAAVAAGATLAIVVFLALRPGAHPDGRAADDATSSTPAPATVAAMTASTGIEATTAGAAIEATAPSAARMTGAAVPAASSGATTGAAPSATATRPAPKATDDVYVDAASPPRNVATAVPSATPTALPSAAPTTTPGQPPPYEEP